MRRIGVAACVTVLAQTLGAQEPRRLLQPDSIPFELASALITAGGVGADPQILVGAMPEWVMSRISLPANGRVLGSALWGTTVVGIVAVPRTTADSLMSRLRRDLLTHGWQSPPPFPSYGGGFRSAQIGSATSGVSQLVLCGNDQQMLMASAMPRRGSEVVITYRLVSVGVGGYSQCKPPQPPQGYTRSPFPTLYNPVGAANAAAGNCAPSNTGWSGTSTAFRSALTPDQILDGYARQLADSGWTTEGANPSIVGRTWAKPDSAGKAVQVSLYVTTGRDSVCHDVNMQVRTLTKP